MRNPAVYVSSLAIYRSKSAIYKSEIAIYRCRLAVYMINKAPAEIILCRGFVRSGIIII
jgi:hypothetical protein